MHLLLMLLLSAGGSSAQESSWFGRLCQPFIVDRTREGAEDIYKSACKRRVKEADCDNYFADKDVPMSDRNTCQFTWIETQMVMPLIWTMYCPSASFDGFFYGADVVGDGVVSAWDVISASGGQIDQPTAAARRHARAEKYKKAIKEQVDFISLPTEEKRRLYDEAQAERDRAFAASKVIENALAESKIKLFCYSPKKQVELSCYGLGVAANNITNLGIGKAAYGVVKGATKKALKFSGGIQEVMGRLYRAAGFRSSGAKLLEESGDKVAKNLGYKPVIQDASRMDEGFVKIQARNPAGEEVAMFTGQLKNEGKLLDTTYTNVPNVADRQKGLSEMMLNEALVRNPKIKQLGSSITEGENLKALEDGLKSSASCAQAMTHTPAYKARARSGFGRIVQAVCEGETPYMVVERGS